MPEVLKIQSTTDYSKFQLMGGNRKIDRNHVRRLETEMEYNPELFQAQPILVNENFFIVDGQHRYQAAKNLGLPIYFIVKSNISIEAARHINIAQRRWTMLDFAQSYADSGRIDYIEYIRVRRMFPRLSATITLIYLAGGPKTSMQSGFRNGEFKIADREEAIENLKRLNDIQDITNIKINTPLAWAFFRLFRDDNEFDYDLFIRKLKAHPEQLEAYAIVRNCLRSIEDVYNFQSKTRVRLY